MQICYLYQMLNTAANIFYLAAILSLVSGGVSATQQSSFAPPPFSHYEPILERMPFGELPQNFGVTVDPNAEKEAAHQKMEQEKLARKINMSAVNITPQGETAIGFTDLSQKPPVSYYLVVGDESGGWKVNSANYTEETAEIEKDGVTIELKMGKGLVQKAPAKPNSHTKQRATLTTIKKPVIRGRTSSRPPALTAKASSSATSIRDQLRNVRSSGGDVKSYMERLRERKIKESAALRKEDENKRKQLEKLARDVAAKEIKKQTKAIAEKAVLQKELDLEEERLLKEQAESQTQKPAQ